MKIRFIEKAYLPTPWGDFLIAGFQEIATGKHHIALLHNNLNKEKPILTRIHSECLTGDTFLSLRCDCGFQLMTALSRIAAEGSGLIIYHRQEGRNIGILNKIRAYKLQDNGYDTVQANHYLGFGADDRDFSCCIQIFKFLRIRKVRLLTNNPKKVKALLEAGINVIERVPLIVGYNKKNKKYLTTKYQKLGHFFDV